MSESQPLLIDRIKNCQGITYLKPHIFYCSNDLANRQDLQDIKHIKANIMEFDRAELFQCISLPETAYLVL